MIRKLLATTAIATLLTSGLWVTGAIAEDATKPASGTQTAAPAAVADGSLVTKIIGADVYEGKKYFEESGTSVQEDGKRVDVLVG